MRITQNEARALGGAWAQYINSIPSRKRKAALEMMERIMPGLVAFGTTATVFLPRVQLIATHRPQEPPPTTVPPVQQPVNIPPGFPGHGVRPEDVKPVEDRAQADSIMEANFGGIEDMFP